MARKNRTNRRPDPAWLVNTAYSGWEDGREYQTTIYDADGTTALRQVTNTFAQRAAVSWWTGSAAAEPPNDPRLVETTTTLLDTNQVSKQTFGYDANNNRTNVKEYDFGSGTAGSLIRETQTSYVTSTTYADLGLLSLPSQVSVYDGSGVERARTTFEYDNYATDTNHAGLVGRSGISGFDSSFGTSYTTRGNPTGTTSYLLNSSGSVTGSITSYAQYDIAGNGVKAIDGRGNAATIDYRDNFGAPADSVESSGSPTNTAPSELGSNYAFAFPFSVTNALSQTAYTKFDYYLGRPVTSEDINGIVSRGYYDDTLDRPSQMIRAVNGGTDTKSQTTFSYDDTNHVITTTSDQAAYNDNILKSSVLYDGLGRMIEKRQYENSTQYIAVKQVPFVVLQDPDNSLAWMSASQSSNPYRPYLGEQAIWTTSFSDSLGRVSKVRTPDNAIVRTSYSGNTVTVTDQTGKARKSVTDGLGRLSNVHEDPAGLNYLTSYGYDTLDSLTTVTQGSQTRTFVYDSLKRLTKATNPESGTVCYGTVVGGVCQTDGYDASGNLVYKTDARGIQSAYEYDALNRVKTRGYSDATPTVTYAYDPAIANGKGRLSSVSSNVSTYTYGNYDALGRVKSASQTTGSQSYTIGYSYDLAGHVTSMTYPSGHAVGYSFDNAGRLDDFSGYLGDGTSRMYSTGIIYSPMGGMTREQFGTTTPIYNKLYYNVRGQLGEIREGTAPGDTGAERGSIINYYSANYGCWGASCNAPDNNGNLMKQEIDVPGSGGFAVQWFGYDALNRLQAVNETWHNDSNGADTDVWKQSYVYDRYGNRTINTNTSATYGGVNNLGFEVETATNRLYAPGDLALAEASRRMRYDAAGNLWKDTYDGSAVTRGYDAENRMTSETQANSYVAGSYSYDGDGRRVKRNIGGVETWQVYGVGGELIAEYAANAAASSPQKEYGYRNGQLLITATITSGSAGTAFSFTDDPLVAGTTTVKAVHLNELRSAVNQARAHAGLPAATWTDDPAQASITPIKAVHITELRTKLNDARLALGLAAATFTDPSLMTGDAIKAAHVQELRTKTNEALTALAGAGVDVRWLVSDQLGTPRMIFDQTGSLAGVSRHDYLPFGELLTVGATRSSFGYTNADGARQQFTQKERDNETALDYFLARYYSSSQGRFTSVDPLSNTNHQNIPQGWNGYSYVLNNPLRLIDPDGMMWIYQYLDKEHKKIGLAWIEGNKLPKDLKAQGYHALDFNGESSKDVTLTNGSVVRLSATSGNPLQLSGPDKSSNKGFLNVGFINEFRRATGPMPKATGAFILISLNGGYAVSASSIALLDAAAFALYATSEQSKLDGQQFMATTTLASSYIDTTKGNSVTNITTSASKSSFIDSLVQEGFTARQVGPVTVLEKGAVKYNVYNVRTSNGAVGAQRMINGATDMKFSLRR